MYLPLPIIHEVSQSCAWPAPVAFFAGLLHQPLPASVTAESHLDGFELSAYLLKGPRSLQGTSDFDGKGDRSESKLSSVLNLVLSTVHTLRAMKRLNCSGSAIPTASAWSLMLRGLASACSRDALIMDDVPCVLPRFETLVEQETFDCLANILISYCIKANDECDSDEELISSNGGSSSEVVNHVRRHITVSEFLNPQLDVDEEEYSTFSSYVESTQETTLPCLDIPLCANVLRGHGPQLCAVLPVICVADPNDIDFLLASILYQRYVWGIDEPAIGITLEKTGFIARIIVGWVNRDHEPTVHIVHPFTLNGFVDPSLGIYDMTRPLSALSLANFILNLEPHFKDIASQAIIDRQGEPGPLCWRSDDTLGLCGWRSTSDSAKWRETIVDWLHDVTEAFVPTVSPLSSERLLFPSNHVDDSSARSPKETTGATCAVIDDESTSSTTFTQFPTQLAATRSTILHNDASQLSSVPSDIEHEYRLLGSWNVSNWLLRRKAFILPWANMYHLILDYTEIRKHLNEYEVLTRLSWPDWSKESMPEVDASVNWLKEKLFHLYESGVQQSSHPMTQLDGVALQIITIKFTMLLNCSVVGTDVVHVRENVSAYKSNAQQCWNWMIMQFCVTSLEEDVSLNVHLEKTISMPHTRMLNELLDENLVENKLKAIISEYYNQCFSDVPEGTHIYGRAASQDLRLLQVQVHDYECEISDFFSKSSPSPKTVAEIMRKQAGLDPSSLICDAILCASISVDKDWPSNIQKKAHEFLRQSQFIVGNHDENLEPSASPRQTSSKTTPYDAMLPLMIFQYKDWKRTAQQTRDEAIMCCVSSVSFLASLGIKSFPVHGLIATGKQARVIVAYQSIDTDNIYVTAENVWRLDLENPLDAFHFATFLLKIRQQYEPRLIELFRIEFLKMLERDDASVYENWAMDT